MAYRVTDRPPSAVLSAQPPLPCLGLRQLMPYCALKPDWTLALTASTLHFKLLKKVGLDEMKENLISS